MPGIPQSSCNLQKINIIRVFERHRSPQMLSELGPDVCASSFRQSLWAKERGNHEKPNTHANIRNRRSQFVAAVTGGMAVTISHDGNSYAYVIQSRAFDGIGGGGNSLIACGLGL